MEFHFLIQHSCNPFYFSNRVSTRLYSFLYFFYNDKGTSFGRRDFVAGKTPSGRMKGFYVEPPSVGTDDLSANPFHVLFY